MNSSTITLHAPIKSKTQGRLDILQMLSGVLLILFLWTHMLLVSSVIIGPGVMNAIAWFLEVTYMAQIGGPMIGLLIFTHFLLAARKMPWKSSESEAFIKHSIMMKHRDTWMWLAQVGTALVILIMAGVHMWVVLTDLPITAVKSAARIQHGGWLPFYLILLPIAEIHVGIGFYRIGVKYGIITAKNRAWYKRKEYALTGGFILIGLITLVRFMYLPLYSGM